LHSDDGGKWGKHLWLLVLDVLKQHGMKGTLAVKSVKFSTHFSAIIIWYYFLSMRNVPRWANLKHFKNVTTVEYTDGQAFLNILKVTQFRIDSASVFDTLYCGKKVLTSRISGPDKYRQVVLGVRRGAHGPMVNCCENYRAFLD
jgi:hypothetical protein